MTPDSGVPGAGAGEATAGCRTVAVLRPAFPVKTWVSGPTAEGRSFDYEKGPN